MDELEIKIKQYYENVHPDSGFINKLKGEISSLENKKEGKVIPLWKTFLKYAAAFALLIVSAYSIYWFTSGNEKNRYQKYANEIAYNHNKRLNAEYLTSDITELNQKMEKLDFSIINSERLNSYEWIGARYCSVQGAIAAQIKLKDSENNICTLYEFKQKDEKYLEQPHTYFVSGNKITIWAESGVIFGLAENKK